MAPAVALSGATLSFGSRVLWSDLDLDIRPGEFVAVLGPNGSGKTSLLRVLLGQLALTSGRVEVNGAPVRRGSPLIGYVPQRTTIDSTAALRGRDLVRLGLDGHRYGVWLPNRARSRQVEDALAAVGARPYANLPISTLSGGELQRLRIAQAIVNRPRLLLCDEPLSSLDLRHADEVTTLIDDVRRSNDIAVLFVTHEINPILPITDRILYLIDGRVRIGTPDQVLRSDVLSELYGSAIEVVRSNGRLVVLGEDPKLHCEPDTATLRQGN